MNKISVKNYLAALAGSVLMFLSATSEAWVVDENFDGLAVGDRCAPFFKNKAVSSVSAEQSKSGSNSCKMAIRKGGKGWGGGFVPPTRLHQGDEVWLRFRLFIPDGFDFNAYSAGNHLKFIRMTLKNAAGTVGRLDWYWDREGARFPHRLILERDKCSTNCWQPFGGVADGPIRNRWETWEMYARFDYASVDDGGQGRVRAWKNGKLIGDLTNRPTMWRDKLNGDSMDMVSFLLFSYWNGGSPATQYLYLEDLVATNTVPGSLDSAGNPYIGVGGMESSETFLNGKQLYSLHKSL